MDGNIALDLLSTLFTGGTFAFLGFTGKKRYGTSLSDFALGNDPDSINDLPWTQYTSNNHPFTVALPGIPAIIKERNETDGISVSDTLYTVHYRGITLWIQVFGYPINQVDIMADPRPHLTVIKEILALEPEVSITCFDNDLEFMGNPAALIDIHRLFDKEQKSFHFLCFIRDNNLYELVAEGPVDSATEIDKAFSRLIDTFFFV